jgi:hypothetical protein
MDTKLKISKFAVFSTLPLQALTASDWPAIMIDLGYGI